MTTAYDMTAGRILRVQINPSLAENIFAFLVNIDRITGDNIRFREVRFAHVSENRGAVPALQTLPGAKSRVDRRGT